MHPSIEALTDRFALQPTRLQVGAREVELLATGNLDRLFDELVELEAATGETEERIPYWAELWPSSVALGEHLLQAEWLGGHTRAIELGCGLGLAGIAAGMRGAQVLLTDYMPEALAVAGWNWERQVGRPAQTLPLDWRNPPALPPFDLVIAADVAYELSAFETVLGTVRKLLRYGGKFLLAEPNRDFAQPFMDRVCRTFQLNQQQWYTITLRGVAVKVRVLEMTSFYEK